MIQDLVLKLLRESAWKCFSTTVTDDIKLISGHRNKATLETDIIEICLFSDRLAIDQRPQIDIHYANPNFEQKFKEAIHKPWQNPHFIPSWLKTT